MGRRLFGKVDGMKCSWLPVVVARNASRFRRDERGVATIFACFMIMMMVLVGGIGVDLMRAEMERTRLQNTLDRAVLAAADLDQTLTPQNVVIDYFEKSGIEDLISAANIQVYQGLNYRTVTARGTTLAPTQFMHLMGVDQLKVPALGTAEERISDVEVSLVLDISGSMANDNRMVNMKAAAKEFVSALIRPETQDLISVSIVPYSEHVNVSQPIYSQLNTLDWHNESWCVEMPDTEFSTIALNTAMEYEQMQHFQWNFGESTYWSNIIDDTICPHEDWEAILPHSQSLSALEGRIDAFVPRAGTSIFMGVKWGAALLDPSTRGIVTNLIGSGTVDGVFSGRPVDHTNPITLKTMVVMTDGKNDSSARITDEYYADVNHVQYWKTYNFWWSMNYHFPDFLHDETWEEKYNATLGDALTHSVCTAAKNAGIVIWGIGFEVDDHGADVLESCASSPSHFFRVEGVEISEAFSAIASQINQLRLTQ